MHTKFRINQTITSKVMTIVCLLCGVVQFCCCSCECVRKKMCAKMLQRDGSQSMYRAHESIGM